uniref:Uncharacterized protein n=1 Tax=Arundo donax TaxID=35708 RepID=A0A0A9GUA7_ARUDO
MLVAKENGRRGNLTYIKSFSKHTLQVKDLCNGWRRSAQKGGNGENLG